MSPKTTLPGVPPTPQPKRSTPERVTIGVVTRTVNLASGGSVTLIAEADVLRLSVEDRALLDELVSAFDAYERAQGSTQKATLREDSDGIPELVVR